MAGRGTPFVDAGENVCIGPEAKFRFESDGKFIEVRSQLKDRDSLGDKAGGAGKLVPRLRRGGLGGL